MPSAAFGEDVAEVVDELEDDVGAGVATVKMCPAKEVVDPEAVANTIADPPEDVTSTIGTPFVATHSMCSARAHLSQCTHVGTY